MADGTSCRGGRVHGTRVDVEAPLLSAGRARRVRAGSGRARQAALVLRRTPVPRNDEGRPGGGVYRPLSDSTNRIPGLAREPRIPARDEGGQTRMCDGFGREPPKGRPLATDSHSAPSTASSPQRSGWPIPRCIRIRGRFVPRATLCRTTARRRARIGSSGDRSTEGAAFLPGDPVSGPRRHASQRWSF